MQYIVIPCIIFCPVVLDNAFEVIIYCKSKAVQCLNRIFCVQDEEEVDEEGDVPAKDEL